ncbi:G-type lectin S-receptor-like serine/threonine-protein kinase [Citrus sinensis]|uniref:G-type lectin S-receptor-like serine/threonine-protein kinase n=1 Tax=Citrus sinensis TaxID=2711 RepID=A0ACB8NZ40_CITSI|nr:G-type lectin S-receptor-like serine/threonine-protein kinase [Citrus sinensis]
MADLVLLCTQQLPFFLSEFSFAPDIITSSQTLNDGRTLISKDGSFELGFFSPGSSKNRYVGIWYKNIPVKTVVWVANRLNLINDSSGFLMINKTGNLVLTSKSNIVVWSAYLSKEVRTPVVLQLLDSGNLVLRGEQDGDSETYFWQSFDYPSDTLLPGMKLGWDLETGLERRVTSWKSFDDPSPGDFIWAIERQDNPESDVPRDQCDTYGLCGAYGICIISQSPVCQCLKGFKHKSGGYVDWSKGCVRNKPLNYSRQDGFMKFTELKLPDATPSWVSKSMNLKESREGCLENSFCMAYTNSDIRGGGSGCAMWFGDLIDMRSFPDGGQDLYIRMSASELGAKGEPTTKIVVIVTSTAALLAAVIADGYLVHKRRRNIVEKTENNRRTEQKNEDQSIDLELPLFELATIANATDNFSINNKLGEGGFGPVYKGTLVDGQEIAVKRLSKISEQGLKELKNEVILFSKLQHRNLVKLLGCCIQGEEKLLIYEFMANRSLDSFIFDQERCKLLDWSKRFRIICGTGRGLLYLHQDSRLRIIHRDLKAGNVLLDQDMNPKISDFGLARTFGGDETEGNTTRVVGTYGYMAPEYASDGQFSVKSDVFSFGILLLEIAWKLWNKGMPSEMIDPCYQESCNLTEVIRCIHISLLCVQQHPDDRPCMPSVILMLGSEIVLPQPKQPGFLADRKSIGPDSLLSIPESSSSNSITISELEAR